MKLSPTVCANRLTRSPPCLNATTCILTSDEYGWWPLVNLLVVWRRDSAKTLYPRTGVGQAVEVYIIQCQCKFR